MYNPLRLLLFSRVYNVTHLVATYIAYCTVCSPPALAIEYSIQPQNEATHCTLTLPSYTNILKTSHWHKQDNILKFNEIFGTPHSFRTTFQEEWAQLTIDTNEFNNISEKEEIESLFSEEKLFSMSLEELGELSPAATTENTNIKTMPDYTDHTE